MDANPSDAYAARLVVEQGPELEQTFTLGNAPQTIGRSANNGVVINDPEISRRHAQITPQGEGYVLEDLGSTNGTFVNGARLSQPMALKHGDSISFGDTVRLRYWAAGRASEVIPSSADRIPTPTLPPEPVPVYAQPNAHSEPAADAPPPLDEFDAPETAVSPNRNRILIGCGCLLLLLCVLCVGGVLFLDSYEQGRLLYCGGLRPFWESILGPLGFNPVCP